jgi:hypothetical protein
VKAWRWVRTTNRITILCFAFWDVIGTAPAASFLCGPFGLRRNRADLIVAAGRNGRVPEAEDFTLTCWHGVLVVCHLSLSSGEGSGANEC